MNPALLDTDTISELLKQLNPIVAANGAAYLKQHGTFAFSAFSRFEIRRGLLKKGATRQLADFDDLCQQSLIFPIENVVLDRASDLWVLARRAGWPHGDADVIIGATALVHGRELATGNASHFSWMPSLKLVDWRQP